MDWVTRAWYCLTHKHKHWSGARPFLGAMMTKAYVAWTYLDFTIAGLFSWSCWIQVPRFLLYKERSLKIAFISALYPVYSRVWCLFIRIVSIPVSLRQLPEVQPRATRESIYIGIALIRENIIDPAKSALIPQLQKIVIICSKNGSLEVIGTNLNSILKFVHVHWEKNRSEMIVDFPQNSWQICPSYACGLNVAKETLKGINVWCRTLSELNVRSNIQNILSYLFSAQMG